MRKWQEILDALRALLDGIKEIKLNSARTSTRYVFGSRAWVKRIRTTPSQILRRTGDVHATDVLRRDRLALFEFVESPANRLVITGHVVSFIHLMAPLQNISKDVFSVLFRGRGMKRCLAEGRERFES